MKKITGLTMAITAIFTFCITAKAQTASPDKITNKVISNYLLVKSALAGNDAGKAKAAAKSLNTAANELAAVHLSAADKALVTKLDYDSRHISEVNLIAHQREHFESLSKNLYALLKDLKNNDNVLYKINCGSGKAFYLSESKTGPDPYKAATNGNKVTETLQPVAN